MKKHLIAAAVAAAVAFPAMAQVTVSGTLDITPFANDTFVIGTATGKRSSTANALTDQGGFSTSVLNFSGSEDLGGGLKASFFVNQDIGGNSGALGTRDRFIALSGGFGEFKVGRFGSIADGYGGFAVAGTTNMAGTSDSSGFDLAAGTLGADNTITANTGAVANAGAAGGNMSRQPGVVQYSTPTMNGLKVTAEYINNSAKGTAEASQKQTSIAVGYTAGPLAINLTNSQRDTKVTTGTTNLEADLTFVGLRYNAGVAVLMVAHGMREDKSSNAKTSDIDVTNFGVQVPLGATTLFASVYDGEDKRDGTAANKRDHDGFQVGARYALSKRTFAYVVTGENNSKGSTAATTSKRDSTAVGLVHSF